MGAGQPLLVAQLIDQVGGVLPVEQGERRVEAQAGGVHAQQAVGDGVKGAGPAEAVVLADRAPPMRAARRTISAAARRVKVSSRTRRGSAPRAISAATRWASVCVLPDPAPATTSSGPSPWSTTRCWAGLRASDGARAAIPLHYPDVQVAGKFPTGAIRPGSSSARARMARRAAFSSGSSGSSGPRTTPAGPADQLERRLEAGHAEAGGDRQVGLHQAQLDGARLVEGARAHAGDQAIQRAGGEVGERADGSRPRRSPARAGCSRSIRPAPGRRARSPG